jgi:hypothetical protein
MPLPSARFAGSKLGQQIRLEEGEEAAPGRPELPLFPKRFFALVSSCQIKSTCFRATSTYAKLLASSPGSA